MTEAKSPCGGFRIREFMVRLAGIEERSRAHEGFGVTSSISGGQHLPRCHAIENACSVDIERRLSTLGDRLAAACPDVEFADVFGRAETERSTPGSGVVLALGSISSC
jgi:hypothetical protein